MAERIAIIGSGMAGLAAADACRRAGDAVTVFEAHDGHGMDAHVLDVAGGRVDVPLRVMSPRAWSSVLQLAARVGIGTFPVDTFVSCSRPDGRTWFRSGRVPLLGWPSVGSWRYLNARSARLALGLLALRRQTRALGAADGALTVAQFIDRHRPDPLFWRGLVLPLLTTICTCDERHLLAWPARELLALLDEILHGGGLVRIQGGTSALVAALGDGVERISGSPVVRVVERCGAMLVRNARGDEGRFDRVIVATQANQVDFLEGERYAEERRVLAEVRFDRGELVVHRDARFMPARREDWTALGFRMDEALGTPMFTVWVNAVEPTLAAEPPVFQTWNPQIPVAPDLVLARVPFQRAVVHTGTAAIHAALATWHRTPGRRVFYCGSWAYPGVPLLESAVRAGQAAAAALHAARG
ncbi:MAG: FAD-dependent oxidoreductase [Pseudomonadales bacterium]|nr:FAD-dependent oxidoreductase [Pseudomonadales bacterium]